MDKTFVRMMCPPVLWTGLSRIKQHLRQTPEIPVSPTNQDLDLYWNADFADELERWGEGNAWNEIELLLVNCRGRVLDCACGPGTVIERLQKFPQLEVHGFDISDFLLEKAVARGIPKTRLTVADATKTAYADNAFDYSYSIGSMEHFTEEGIESFIVDNSRVTSIAAFHFVPVSRSETNTGWIRPNQSYFNNSTQWWLDKFKPHFASVYALDSKWEDSLSLGRWFVCLKKGAHENS